MKQWIIFYQTDLAPGPHHFTLTDAAVAGSERFWHEDGRGVYGYTQPDETSPSWPAYDTRFKMNPPLRAAEDRAGGQERVGADDDIVFDDGAGVDRRMGADGCVRMDDGARADEDALADGGAW